MSNETVILGALGVLVFGALVWFFTKLRKAQDEIKEIIARRFPEEAIRLRDPGAYFVARELRTHFAGGDAAIYAPKTGPSPPSAGSFGRRGQQVGSKYR